MKKEYVLGTDIGTSGCKSIIVDNKGKVVASAVEEYPLYTPRPGWSEQDPCDWYNATINTINSVIRKSNLEPQSIKAIGLSGQMHGLVPLDKNNSVIRRAYLWNDQRSFSQCQKIIEAAGGEQKLLTYTNNSMLPGYTGGKILWLRENEPQNYERSAIFLNPKDYIRLMLTGEKATEVSDASGTGLFNVSKRKWSTELLSIIGIQPEFLPKCYESTDITGYTTGKIHSLTGLPKNTPVAGGGGDAVIQTTGTGLIKEGILGVTIGTAGIVAMGLESFKFNSTGKLQIFCNNAPGKWHIMGVTLAAGGSFQWFKNNLCKYEIEKAGKDKIDVYRIIDDAVKKSSLPGSKNLIFLPYLIGERCPFADPNARGVFLGLTLRHTHEDMARSVMEGVTYSLKQVYELIISMDSKLAVKEVRISGGGSNSSLWRQITADIFQLPVKTVSGNKEGGAYGAALVAGTSIGFWENLEEATSMLIAETELPPDTANKEKYDELYSIYTECYPVLKNIFDKIA